MSMKLKKVSYVYSEGDAFEKKALDEISLEIPDGQFIGIIGHTGSGKSTLIQHLNGLLRATSGAIYYDGENIYQEGYDMRTLRSKVGLVFQYPEHQLFEVDVFSDVCFGPKNLGLSKEEVEERAKKALTQVGLDESYYKKSPFELSGGQKRRVAIAGILAMHPQVLILDEPTAGLDPKGRDEILDQVALLQKERKITVILVSHSMEDVARYVDRIIVVNDGKILFDDTPKQVFQHYKELESVGLAAPQVTYVVKALKEKGWDGRRGKRSHSFGNQEKGKDMLRDITLGQYYPSDSVIHKMDPRVKLFGTIVFIISLFLFQKISVYVVATLFLAAVIMISKVPFSFMVKGLKGIFVLMMITVVFNLFLTPGTSIIDVWLLRHITWEGLEKAVYMGIRLILLILGSSIMTLTTTPNALTDGLEKSLGFLKKVKIPVHEIAMTMSIALRFIPILIEETDKIMKAQTARGADFESGGFIKKAKAMVPLLVPLFISAFRRASDLAMAMEARCYHGDENRTKMKPLKYAAIDKKAYGCLLLYMVVMVVLAVMWK